MILELRDILRRGYLPPAEVRKLFDEPPAIPLRRFEDQARLDAHPPALRESRARALGRSLAAALPEGAPPPELSSLGDLVAPATYRGVAHALGLCPPPRALAARADARAGAAAVVVPLRTLLQFLEDPLQGAAGFRLRMREIEGEEERIDRDDEPLETARRDRTSLLRAVMLAVLTRDRAGHEAGGAAGGAAPDWSEVRQSYQALARQRELLGQIPTGLYRAAERPGDERILATWWRQTLEVGAGRPPQGGWCASGAPARTRTPATCASRSFWSSPATPGPGACVEPRRIEIVGRTELLVEPAGGQAGAGSLVFSCRRASDDSDGERELLRAFLDHVALAAAGLSSGPFEALLAAAEVAGLGQPALDRRLFRPLDRAGAIRYLSALVTDLLTGAPDPASGLPTGVHPYLLPFDAIFEARLGKKSLVEAIEDRRENYLERNRRLRARSMARCPRRSSATPLRPTRRRRAWPRPASACSSTCWPAPRRRHERARRLPQADRAAPAGPPARHRRSVGWHRQDLRPRAPGRRPVAPGGRDAGPDPGGDLHREGHRRADHPPASQAGLAVRAARRRRRRGRRRRAGRRGPAG